MKGIFLIGCFLLLSVAISGENKHRTKRKVVFSKSSKFFFRLNGKDNIINSTTLFAHGWSFRVNFDLPETLQKRHKFFKRDVREVMLDDGQQNVYSCALKYFCRYYRMMKDENCGILCQIGEIVARSSANEADFFRSLFDKCEFHENNCPYSFTDAYVSSYG